MDKLDEYVKKELEKGFSRKQVKATLLKAGWQKEEIDKSLKNTEEYEFPQHKYHTQKFWVAIACIIVIVILLGAVIYNYSYLKPKKLEQCRGEKGFWAAYNCLYDNKLINDNNDVAHKSCQNEECDGV